MCYQIVCRISVCLCDRVHSSKVLVDALTVKGTHAITLMLSDTNVRVAAKLASSGVIAVTLVSVKTTLTNMTVTPTITRLVLVVAATTTTTTTMMMMMVWPKSCLHRVVH
jgi:hypothetical protein